MTVANRLRGAFALYIALLAALLVYHVRTIQRTVRGGQALTAISDRLRVTSTGQLVRIGEIQTDVQKYLVTGDRDYLDQAVRSAHAYDAELQRLDSMALSRDERTRFTPLVAQWRIVDGLLARLAEPRVASGITSGSSAQALAVRLQRTLDDVRDATQAFATASQDAMSRELDQSERAARAAERLSWLAAIVALLLSVVLSALLARSIVMPLERLTEGTREVSAGRFDYRLRTDSGDEFSQVARAFNSMTARLDELDRMKRDFVSKISHDLKTPLSSMQETIQVLLDEVAGPVSVKQRHLLELNLESGQRLSGMLTKLLDLSRIEAGLEPDLQLLDITQLVRRSVERAAVAGAARGVALSLVEPPRRLLVRGDADALGQVVDNLLENAIKFSPHERAVRVSILDVGQRTGHLPPEQMAALRGRGVQGGTMLITVADEGPGVPDDEKDRIFSRFYQTEAGRAVRGRGVGLGLAICREIVARHAGAIWVSDNRPNGSVFSVLLPGAVSVSDEPPRAASVGGAADATSGGDGKLL